MGYQVFDNFTPHIDGVLQSAHAAGFGAWKPNKGEVGSSVYEGMSFWGDHAPMLHALMGATAGMVVPNSMFFRATNVGMEGAYIHSDRMSGSFTCVAYLTDHDDEYGTAFWRHRRTGLYEMPTFPEMKERGIFEELREDMVSRDPSKWERVDFVSGRKNRALVFSAPLFHSRVPVDGFGDTADDARIVWVSHFHKIAPNGELI